MNKRQANIYVFQKDTSRPSINHMYEGRHCYNEPIAEPRCGHAIADACLCQILCVLRKAI